MINNILTKEELESRERLKSYKPLVYNKVIKYNEKLLRNESIAIIQLHLTYLCNFHCKHCSVSSFRNQKKERILTIRDIKNLSKQADELGLAHIDITGGEVILMPNFNKYVEAIDPAKFYLQVDTNGYLMDDGKAKYLKEIGIDKIQLSLDNFNSKEHDIFRNRKGSYERTIRAVDSIKNAGLKLQIATVVTHQRAKSKEFIQFLEWAKSKEVSVSTIWPKLVGEWEGHYELAITSNDIKYIHNLKKKYNVYDHLTPMYGRNLGCIAVKRMISINQFGFVMPCIWMYFSLGNIFEMSLKDILEKGMKYFGREQKKCLVSESKEFIEKYISQTYDRKDLPIPIEKVMPEGKYEI